MFHTLYRPVWVRAVEISGLHPGATPLLDPFVSRLRRPKRIGALKTQHKRLLMSLKRTWEEYMPEDVCIACLFRRPEHFVSCGHGFCDVDLRRYGRSLGQHWFVLDSCLLCGSPCRRTFDARPPTRGPRILSLDGGGIQGIILLEYLLILEEKLRPYLPGYPVQNHFDYSIGTSAGTWSRHWTEWMSNSDRRVDCFGCGSEGTNYPGVRARFHGLRHHCL